MSSGHWGFSKGEESNSHITDGIVAGVRMIIDPNADGPQGPGTLMVIYEANPDVHGSGFWEQHVPDGPYADSLRSQSRSHGPNSGPPYISGPPGGEFLHPWISNMDCDDTPMLVDRVRIYEISELGSELPENRVSPGMWAIFE